MSSNEMRKALRLFLTAGVGNSTDHAIQLQATAMAKKALDLDSQSNRCELVGPADGGHFWFKFTWDGSSRPSFYIDNGHFVPKDPTKVISTDDILKAIVRKLETSIIE